MSWFFETEPRPAASMRQNRRSSSTTPPPPRALSRTLRKIWLWTFFVRGDPGRSQLEISDKFMPVLSMRARTEARPLAMRSMRPCAAHGLSRSMERSAQVLISSFTVTLPLWLWSKAWNAGRASRPRHLSKRWSRREASALLDWSRASGSVSSSTAIARRKARGDHNIESMSSRFRISMLSASSNRNRTSTSDVLTCRLQLVRRPSRRRARSTRWDGPNQCRVHEGFSLNSVSAARTAMMSEQRVPEK
mmetsp:Transcript_23201/g.65870  ORF Transcript_23201/g.65870 Transcript_23201/m.65870 type:complete len:248 (+) Transcript_23201:230-973(+)